MTGLENFGFMAGLVTLGIAVILQIWQVFVTRRQSGSRSRNAAKAGASGMNLLTVIVIVASFLLITLSMIARTIITGHGPFSSMYEFALAFSWGIIGIALFFWWRYRIAALNLIALIAALALMLFALSQPSRAIPLVPALQNSLLLSVHVASAVVAYGALTVSFATAVLFLMQKGKAGSPTSSGDVLDSISYHAVLIGFPFMTLLIILGALWADIAWGRYWSWDPKETASLVTWLIYAAYLHARIMRGWRGRRTAWLLVIGFAAIIFTFFGNYIFSGLHAYG